MVDSSKFRDPEILFVHHVGRSKHKEGSTAVQRDPEPTQSKHKEGSTVVQRDPGPTQISTKDLRPLILDFGVFKWITRSDDLDSTVNLVFCFRKREKEGERRTSS